MSVVDNPTTVPGSGLPPGLDVEEAARRLEADGPNVVPRAAPRRLGQRVLAQLRDPMVVLLCAAFVVVLALGDVPDALIIAAVVVANTAIGVVQERRAENAINALDRLAAPRARVVRSGRLLEIDAAELVVGDVVRLDAGDVVPADLQLGESVMLEIDEASMTGESVPVPRRAGEEVLSGTVVTRGRAFGTALRVGAHSGLGRIAALVASGGVKATPLQQRLSRLSRTLVRLVVVLSFLVLGLGLAQGRSFEESVILAVSLAVAAIPESLPAVVSVALALGAYRMARRSAVVRWLPAVETLGSVSVLASDKTGTVTEGRMTVQRLWTPEGQYAVTGSSDAQDGRVVDATPGSADVDRLLRDVVLCNDARIVDEDGSWQVLGDPMEGALLVAAAKHDEALLGAAERWPRVDELPFDHDRRTMETGHVGPDGRRLLVVKGAPEVVLERVPPSGTLDRARAAARDLTESGYRVLAVVDDERGGDPQLVGLVGMVDPAREGAAAVVAECRAAGIRPILITGDHPATARAIAEEVGIFRADGLVVEGADVDRGDHVERVEQIDVYARTRPEQKVAILDAWKARGHVVAMTGDGVNDAPALRSADIGVAMGGKGTEVARQAADLVLADDNLRTVVTAVSEGRRIYANIRTFLRYGLAGGLAEVLVIVLGPLLGMPVVLLPAQILWINLLTHGIPGVAFGGEPLDPDVMRRPSPSPERSVLGGGLARQIAVGGVLIAVASLAAGLLADAQGWHVPTTVFATLGLAQLAYAIALRAPRVGLRAAERGLEIAVAAACALQVGGILVPPLRDLLGTQPLGRDAWLTAVALAVVPAVLLVLDRRIRRIRQR